ncbi:MAG: MurT ligase domain-containing protein [Patescibacteria group bacterium]
MQTKTRLAFAIGKLTQLVVRKIRKGRGEAAPGLVALKLDPEFIGRCHEGIGQRIIISGTNGKTTTTNLIAAIFKGQNHSFLTNPSGSNLERGIAASLLSLKPTTHTVLWEADEAALIPIATQVQPTHIVLMNIFRDQLDRYGEIDTTLYKWLKLLKTLPKATIFLNADDPNLVFLGSQLKRHDVFYFGVEADKTETVKLKHSADAVYCPICHRELRYKSIQFSHLGSYNCVCGFARPKPHFAATNLKLSLSKATFSVAKKRVTVPLMGTYNAYNALAAFALSFFLKLDTPKILQSMKTFKPVTGRQEMIEVKDKQIKLLLVKNPTGFDQVIDTLHALKKKVTLCIAINDRIADGTDVSWLWDVDFEKLAQITKKVIATGDRAHDLAVRLKYAGFSKKQFLVSTNKEKAVQAFLKSRGKQLFLLPTYTALWELRKLLRKQV